MKTNYKQFLKKYKQNQQKVLDASANTVNATMFEMYGKIVSRTPVGNPSLWHYPVHKDYDPGTLRNSWNISFNGTIRNSIGQFSSSSKLEANGGISFKLDSNNKDKGAVISNAQPYALRVEAGWSTQAPQGMMRITVAEYQNIINSNVSRYKIK